MAEQTKFMRNSGWALTALSGVPVVLSGVMKLLSQPAMVDNFVQKFGYPEAVMVPLGVVEIICALLYLVPRTSILGAILLTGYLGGAVATHVRIGEMFIPPLTLGVLAWAGLYLRSPQVRALLPLRAKS